MLHVALGCREASTVGSAAAAVADDSHRRAEIGETERQKPTVGTDIE